MFTSDALFYYILDDRLDPHYADCLVEMDPTAYIWYRLRQHDAGQNIVFCSMRDQALHTEALDPESELFLNPPVTFFSLWKKETGEDGILAKLLSSAAASEHSTALVFTHDAFEHICRISNDQGQKKLMSLIAQPSRKIRICIRLPLNADQLAKLIHTPPTGSDVLSAAYAPLCGAAGMEQLPLLTVLEAQLFSQFLHFDQSPGEMKNLLMMRAIENPDIAGSMAQLEDQAEYLELSRQYRTPWLAAAASADRSTTVSRKRIDELLHTEDFVRKLRQRVAELRSKYAPDTSIESILRQERLVLSESGQLIYNDRLSNSVRSLTLPDEFLRHPLSDQISWPAVLDQIRRDLTTLWNKPRNSFAVQAAEDLCGSAMAAIQNRVWETLDTVLRLLQFFSRQICAPQEQTEMLKDCWNYCREAIQISNYLYGDQTFGLPSGFHKFINTSIRAGNEAYLEQLKFHLHQTIQTLDQPTKAITDMVSELESDKNRTMADLSEANRQLEQKRAQMAAEEQARREVELLSRYTTSGGTELQPENIFPQLDSFRDLHISAASDPVLADDAPVQADPFRQFDMPTLPGMADDPELQSIGSILWPKAAAKDDEPCDNNTWENPDFPWD